VHNLGGDNLIHRLSIVISTSSTGLRRYPQAVHRQSTCSRGVHMYPQGVPDLPPWGTPSRGRASRGRGRGRGRSLGARGAWWGSWCLGGGSRRLVVPGGARGAWWGSWCLVGLVSARGAWWGSRRLVVPGGARVGSWCLANPAATWAWAWASPGPAGGVTSPTRARLASAARAGAGAVVASRHFRREPITRYGWAVGDV
jgi:hypothetical protein